MQHYLVKILYNYVFSFHIIITSGIYDYANVLNTGPGSASNLFAMSQIMLLGLRHKNLIFDEHKEYFNFHKINVKIVSLM